MEDHRQRGFSTKFSCDDFIANKPTFSASLGGYLVAIKCTPHFSSKMIWAHSPYSKSWIPVSKICTQLGFDAVLVSRASELVLFSPKKVLKITLCGKLELHCKDFLGKAVTVMFLLSNF